MDGTQGQGVGIVTSKTRGEEVRLQKNKRKAEMDNWLSTKNVSVGPYGKMLGRERDSQDETNALRKRTLGSRSLEIHHNFPVDSGVF